MQKIIVTGKNGIVSVAVANHLKKNGCAVINLGLRDDNWRNIAFTDCDSLIHVAGIVPREGIVSDDYYNINYKLTEELAKKAKAEGVRQFVYISSMAVYGIVPTLKKNKGIVYSDTPCEPISDYGKSKLLAEKAILKLQDEKFKIAIIRVPSIYGVGKTEYLEQYIYSVGRLNVIPKAFADRYKSIICVDNLCQLIYLLIKNESEGVFCPDDGRISAFDLASSIMPTKKHSVVLGLIVKLLSMSDRITNYYGAVCYDEALTEIFGSEYRICDFRSVIKKCYEK